MYPVEFAGLPLHARPGCHRLLRHADQTATQILGALDAAVGPILLAAERGKRLPAGVALVLSTPRSSGPPNRPPQIAAPAGPSAYGDHRPSSHSRPREAIPRGHERRESAILVAMITAVVRQSGFSKQTAWWSKTRDAAPGQLVPADIEGGELREELQLAIRQMIVDPPCHRLPL